MTLVQGMQGNSTSSAGDWKSNLFPDIFQVILEVLQQDSAWNAQQVQYLYMSTSTGADIRQIDQNKNMSSCLVRESGSTRRPNSNYKRAAGLQSTWWTATCCTVRPSSRSASAFAQGSCSVTDLKAASSSGGSFANSGSSVGLAFQAPGDAWTIAHKSSCRYM